MTKPFKYIGVICTKCGKKYVAMTTNSKYCPDCKVIVTDETNRKYRAKVKEKHDKEKHDRELELSRE